MREVFVYQGRNCKKMSGLVKKIKEMWNPAEESDQENISVEPGEYDIFSPKKNKVLDLNSAKNSRSKIVLSRPERFGEEIKNIADELLKMHAVVLNLELTPKADAKRLIDFLSGVAYAIDGKIKNISVDTFVITPRNMEISGDDILSEFENTGIYF